MMYIFSNYAYIFYSSIKNSLPYVWCILTAYTIYTYMYILPTTNYILLYYIKIVYYFIGISSQGQKNDCLLPSRGVRKQAEAQPRLVF